MQPDNTKLQKENGFLVDPRRAFYGSRYIYYASWFLPIHISKRHNKNLKNTNSMQVLVDYNASHARKLLSLALGFIVTLCINTI